MSLNPFRRGVNHALAAMPGVRTVRRPVTPEGAEQFTLHYVRSGPLSAHPVVIIPGGPGVASIQLYRRLRHRAAALGLDVVMVEHRGVGMSRHTDAGADLPPEAFSVDQVVDDVAAVLDDLGVETAVCYGTSYGSYLAAGIGVRHRDRVHAMILDSPVLSAQDLEEMRAALRGLLLGGAVPGAESVAPKVRRLLAADLLPATAAEVAAYAYSHGGVALLNRLLDLLLTGHTLLWRAMVAVSKLTLRPVPYHNEVDLVGRIAFRELDYAGQPDGLPLDPAAALLAMADQIPGYHPEFEGEPYDLTAELPKFDWPTVVISGQRDLTTPPAVAERAAALIPAAQLVSLPTAAHSALDTRESAALRVIKAVVRGRAGELPAEAAELDALPANPSMRLLVGLIGTAAALEAALPPSRRAPGLTA
jgi:pimeloyl-ACP methyl ester carboxylesterase